MRLAPLAREVLDAVRPGEAFVIGLQPKQRELLSDQDGRLALSLLQHTLAARQKVSASDQLPFTGEFVQRLARRLEHRVGEHKALRLIARLVEAQVLLPSGSYRQAYDARQPSGFRVRLFRVATWLRPKKSSVRSRKPRRPWWMHPLFGFGSQTFPKELPRYLQRCHPPPGEQW